MTNGPAFSNSIVNGTNGYSKTGFDDSTAATTMEIDLNELPAIQAPQAAVASASEPTAADRPAATAPSNTPAAVTVGSVLADRYEITREISTQQFQARDRVRGMNVAVQIIANVDRDFDRLNEVVRTAQAISHPGIARVYDLQRTADFAFITTEFVEGCTLREEIERRAEKQQRFKIEEVLRIAGDLCSALAAGHVHVTHGCVDVDSIRLGRDGTARLVDYGTAPFVRTEGNVEYGDAPAEKRRRDQRDVAAVVYELLTGQSASESSLPPHRVRTNVPERLSRTVMRAISHRRIKQYRSMKHFQQQLQKPAVRTTHPAVTAAMILTVLVIASAAIWYVRHRQATLAELKPEFARRLGQVQDLKQRADQLTDTIDSYAMKLATDLEKAHQDLASARDGKKRTAEAIAEQKIERLSPQAEIAQQVADLWERHHHRKSWMSDATGHLSAAEIHGDDGDYHEAIAELDEAESTLTQLLVWRPNTTEVLQSAKVLRSELETRMAEHTGEPADPYGPSLRIAESLTEKLLTDDGSQAKSALKAARKQMLTIAELITTRHAIETAALRPGIVGELPHAHEEYDDIDALVVEADNDWSTGNLKAAEEKFQEARTRYAAAPLMAFEELLSTIEGSTDAATTVRLVDELFDIEVPRDQIRERLAVAVLLRAEARIEQHDLPEAVSDCDEALRLHSDVADVYKIRARANHGLGNYQECIKDCEQALSRDASVTEALVLRGQSRYELGQFDEALADFDAAIKQDGSLAVAFAGRAQLHADNGELEQALADCSAALERNPNVAAVHALRGNIRRLQGEYDLAIADCSESLRLDSESVEALTYRGAAWSGLGRYNAALTDLNSAIELDSKSEAARFFRGIVRSTMGDFRNAIDDFSVAIRADDTQAAIYLHRASAWASLGESRKAIMDYDVALKLDRDLVEAYVRRGDLYLIIGQLDKAIADYSEALDRQADRVDAWVGRASAFQSKGDYRHAVEDSTAALAYDDCHLRALDIRAVANYELHGYDETVVDCSKIIELDADAGFAYAYRAASELERRNFDQAIDDATEAIKFNPLSVWCYRIRAQAFFGKGETQAADEDYEIAMSLSQN